MDSRRSTRRQFLRGAARGAIGLVLAACGLTPSAASPTAPLSSESSAPSTSTPSPLPTPVSSAGPSLRDRIGQMLLVGFRGLTVDQASEVFADIRDRNLGGVLLYDTDLPTHSAIRNIRDPAQLKSLVAGLKATNPLVG